jgi:hypothetical protein
MSGHCLKIHLHKYNHIFYKERFYKNILQRFCNTHTVITKYLSVSLTVLKILTCCQYIESAFFNNIFLVTSDITMDYGELGNFRQTFKNCQKRKILLLLYCFWYLIVIKRCLLFLVAYRKEAGFLPLGFSLFNKLGLYLLLAYKMWHFLKHSRRCAQKCGWIRAVLHCA